MLAEATTAARTQRLLEQVKQDWNGFASWYGYIEFASLKFLAHFGLDADGGCPRANERLAALPFSALELDWERDATIASVRAAGIRLDAPLLEGIEQIKDPAFLEVVDGLRDELLKRLRWGAVYPLVMAQLQTNLTTQEREILRLDNLAAGVKYFPRAVRERSLRDIGVSAAACGRIARALGHAPTVDDLARLGGWEIDNLPGVGRTTVAEVARQFERMMLELVEAGVESSLPARAAARYAGAEEAVAGLDDLESLFSTS